MAERISPDRALRICDVCGGVDDHPRHVLAAGVGEIPVNEDNLKKVLADNTLDVDDKARIVADIIDTTTQLRHLDCCRNIGCPDGSCDIIVPHGTNVIGAEMLDHIVNVGAPAFIAIQAQQEADFIAALQSQTPEAIESDTPAVEAPAPDITTDTPPAQA